MISVNGYEINVGDNVFILLTPIMNGHEFICGKVVGMTDKLVVVEALAYRHKWDKVMEIKEFRRYPNQVFVDK